MTSYIEDYFRTTFATKLMVHMPEREDDHLTPATRLLEKRREMAEVDQALSAQKEEFQMKMESLEQRRDELERKELDLKENLLKFDKFLKENDSKKARAVKKASDEKELRKQKDKEIVRLRTEMESFGRKREVLLERLRRNERYQKFMENVLDIADDFSETREVIARFDTLTYTRTELMERDVRNQQMLDQMRGDHRDFIETKTNEILRYNNQLAELRKQMEKAASIAVEWESKWNRVKNTASEKTLLFGKVKMVIHNLYLLALSNQSALQQQVAENADLDSFEQLEKLSQYVSDLAEVVQTVRKQIASGSGTDHTTTTGTDY